MWKLLFLLLAVAIAQESVEADVDFTIRISNKDLCKCWPAHGPPCTWDVWQFEVYLTDGTKLDFSLNDFTAFS